MKVTVNNAKTVNDRPYPKLMVSNGGCIILMKDLGGGTCLEVGDTDNHVGKYSDYWDMSQFTDFEGSLTIENDEF